MRRPADRRPLALALACLAGCTATSGLRGRLDATRLLLAQAERNGARECAPRELAVGRSHAGFADRELDQGHFRRAEEHFTEADVNARAALRMSPADRCVPRAAVGDRDGDGYLDPVDRCPDDPETWNAFQDEDGCPDDPDTDGDGLVDSRDVCPIEPEDRDGYLDEDGCPDGDNDADGVPDATDNCRDEPEDRDGYNDPDGCPDPDNDQDTVPDLRDQCPNEPGPVDNNGCPRAFEHLQITQHGVRFRVEFDVNRATLRPGAAVTLDEVVQYLAQPQNRALRYEVGGHTSSEGGRAHNERLSAARAATVRAYLLAHGVEGARLTSRGYGPRQPLESNRTAAGRAANRRVELNEIDAAGRIVR